MKTSLSVFLSCLLFSLFILPVSGAGAPADDSDSSSLERLEVSLPEEESAPAAVYYDETPVPSAREELPPETEYAAGETYPAEEQRPKAVKIETAAKETPQAKTAPVEKEDAAVPAQKEERPKAVKIAPAPEQKPVETAQSEEKAISPRAVSRPKRYAVSGDAYELESSSDNPDVFKGLSEEEINRLRAEETALIETRIQAKLYSMKREYLADIEKFPGVKIAYNTNNLPSAITIGEDILFSGQVRFRISANKLLTSLMGLLYSLSEASITIIPSGAYLDESTVLDMRRAMALNNYFATGGISSARMKVKVSVNSSDNFYSLLDPEMKGVSIVFNYDKQYTVRRMSDVSPQEPPALTIGAHPETVNTAVGQGSIIEFAVIETASKIKDWTFEILDVTGGGAFVERARGANPVFHQIFWNGRKSFTGEPLPSGKYICEISAQDITGRTAKMRKVVTLISPSARRAPRAAPKKPVVVRRLKPSAPSFKIYFAPGTAQLEKSSAETISRIGEALARRSYSRIVISGISGASEADPRKMSAKRAIAVKRIFIEDFAVSDNAIVTTGRISDSDEYYAAVRVE